MSIIETLWQNYVSVNPQAENIVRLLSQDRSATLFDHITLCTLNVKGIRLDDLAKVFQLYGYEIKEKYLLSGIKVSAIYMSHPENTLPKIFMSELILDSFSHDLKNIIHKLMLQIDDAGEDGRGNFPFNSPGVMWRHISWESYLRLKSESEYAARLAVFGFNPVGFSCPVSAVCGVIGLEDVNNFLMSKNSLYEGTAPVFMGSKDVFFEKMIIPLPPVEYEFSDGVKRIPGGYFSFCNRYQVQSGEAFQGFIPSIEERILGNNI